LYKQLFIKNTEIIFAVADEANNLDLSATAKLLFEDKNY
jgi:hypothetical protein